VAENNLTPKDDLATRDFLLTVVNNESYLADLPASRRDLISTLLMALNYDWLPNGSFVRKGQNIVMRFGQSDYSAYPDEWPADKEKAIEALNSKDTVEASASEPSADTEVRKAVLSEDV